MFLELSLAHSVRAHVQQRRPGVATGTQPVNAEAREDDPFPSNNNRNELGGATFGLNSKLTLGPLKSWRGISDHFLDRAEAIAHGNKVGDSAIAVKPPQGWRSS
jgi:hypothetical protein